MSDPISNIKNEFIEQSLLRMDEYMAKIEKCLNELNEEDVWLRSNKSQTVLET